MKNYELVCILDPQFGDNHFATMVEKYEGYLVENKATVVNIDHWGMRRMAYSSASLKKRQQGYYVLFQFTAQPSILSGLEHQLGLDEGVLRHLVVGVKGEFMRVPQLVPEGSVFQDSSPRDRDTGRYRGAPSPAAESGGTARGESRKDKPEADDGKRAREAEGGEDSQKRTEGTAS